MPLPGVLPPSNRVFITVSVRSPIKRNSAKRAWFSLPPTNVSQPRCPFSCSNRPPQTNCSLMSPGGAPETWILRDFACLRADHQTNLVNDLKSGQMLPSGRTSCPESEAAQLFKARELASEADDSSRFWKFGRSEQRVFRATGDRSCFVWRNHFSPDILFLLISAQASKVW